MIPLSELTPEDANREAALLMGWTEVAEGSSNPLGEFWANPAGVQVWEANAHLPSLFSPMTDANDADRVADAIGVVQITFDHHSYGWKCVITIQPTGEERSAVSFFENGSTRPAALTLAAIRAGRERGA